MRSKCLSARGVIAVFSAIAFLSGASSNAQTLLTSTASSSQSDMNRDYVQVDAPSALLLTSTSALKPTDPVPDQAQGVTAADLTPARMAAARRRQHQEEEVQRNTDCEAGALRGKPCSVSWFRLLGESFIFLSAQHGGNIWMDSDTRINLQNGSFWGDYAYCVEHYRWSRWKDDDPFGVDYIGHPMMGSVTNSMYEQNDPKQRALTFENTHRYWFGRLRATAYSAAYSAQWKVGPLSEASIGNTGIGYYRRARDGVITNETGMQDFFITPIGGLAWNVGEDIVDRYIFRHVLHAHPRNKALLAVAAIMTPTRAAANASRFRAFYYRDMDEQSQKLIGASR